MKPILFNTKMVKAILEGRKTVTRRIVKPQPPYATYSRVKGGHGCEVEVAKNYYMNPSYKPGDILYVRETMVRLSRQMPESYEDEESIGYFADLNNGWTEHDKIPSIHMPKEAARIFLKVKNVRVERLQDITDEQAQKEGPGNNVIHPKGWFCSLWDSTVKKQDQEKYGYKANPYVWVIEFEQCEKPND